MLGALTAVKRIMAITLTETKQTQVNCELGTSHWAWGPGLNEREEQN